MADVLKHPKHDQRFDEWVHAESSGAVMVKAPAGQVLTVAEAVFLLERAKQKLLLVE